ncbi:MAG TPA: enoyl-CoA hydratase/isomerase family protein [Candidatus Saccharimonadales bacterium]|jgi:cyclohexa-1,5-dienecarbonyl-CoA hydratase|nr:enoyl-CoA hydratase/isomerase family protein [Candidatus Saccharimonadales bacterium]
MTTALATRLSLSFQGQLARLTLANPPLNVIDFQMMDELSGALRTLEQHPEVSAVVISGGERAFSAGVDVAIHTPDKIQEMLTKFHGVVLALSRCRKITIAEVHGVCLGGGAELAMICDMAYTTEKAKWGFPEITLGCYPPVACAALAALVGQKRAANLVFTGRVFSGQEAAEWGLANEAHPEGELQEVLQSNLDYLFKLSPAALSVAKKAFYAWDAIHLDKGLARAEKIYLEDLMQTEDANEGIRSFLEKRKPVWKGR